MFAVQKPFFGLENTLGFEQQKCQFPTFSELLVLAQSHLFLVNVFQLPGLGVQKWDYFDQNEKSSCWWKSYFFTKKNMVSGGKKCDQFY